MIKGLYFSFLHWSVSGDHKLIAVEDLADLARSKLEPFRKQAEEKFEELSAIFKETTIQISQWDVDTESYVKIIHKARDEQVKLCDKSKSNRCLLCVT